MYATILYAVEDGIARLTFNRPDRLNSFNDAMHVEVRNALDRVAADRDVRTLLVTGAGRGFCAGQDLAERNLAPGAPAVDLGDSIDRNWNQIVVRLRRVRVPIVCAVNGVAAGAGANIALACDIVVACRSASFIQAFCKIGLVPDTGGTYWLPRLVGTARAMGLALLGERLAAEQAQAWGLIWKCVDDDALAAEALAIARQLAASPPKALARIKEALHASLGNALEEQLDVEKRFQRELGFSADYREGVAAFMQKRSPVFRGD